MDRKDMRDLLVEKIDACFQYVTLHVSNIEGYATPIDDCCIVENTLFFIVFGNERSYRDVTDPSSLRLRQLKDVVEWAQENVKQTEVIRERMLRLKEFIRTTRHQQQCQ